MVAGLKIIVSTEDNYFGFLLSASLVPCSALGIFSPFHLEEYPAAKLQGTCTNH